MQDKEFDKLFNSKLDGLEVEPSAKVWQGIDRELSGDKRKKLIPFLSIAASIIVMIAAGLVFIPKKEHVKNSSVKNRMADNKTSIAKSVAAAKLQVITEPKTNMPATKKSAHLINIVKIVKPIATPNKEQIIQASLPVATNNINQVLAVTTSTKTDIKQAAITDSSTALAAIKPVIQQADGLTNAAIGSSSVEKTTEVAQKKHRIHGIGDLLNVAIAAVDKRKDKIIEFSDTDDGSTITGVNLGIIKVKTK